jgi:hypothetical protein
MTRTPAAGFAVALGLSLAVSASSATAAPPQISGIVPFGVQRGVAVDLSVNGSNLAGNPRLIAPVGFTLATPAPAGSDASSWKLKLTVDPAAAVGVYVVRVQTDDGLSNPFLFSVGQLPQVAEKEDNNSFETAQVVAAPTVIEGQAAGNDVDYFKFAGKKGQKVLVDAQCARIGSGVDPSIRLTTADRAYVASADDSPGLLTDARLVAVLPVDGDYVIELSDSRYQGGTRPIYRLVVGEVPVAEELFPIGARAGETVGLELRGGSLDGVKIAASRPRAWFGIPLARARIPSAAPGLYGPAALLDIESLPALIVGGVPEVRESDDPAAAPARAAVPVVLNGRIDPPGDEDRFTLAVTPGQKLRIEVEAAEASSALDGVLQVLGAGGTVLATADDTTGPPNPKNAQAPRIVSPDPSLNFTVPSGLTEMTLALRDLESRGGVGFPYRINVTSVVPDFDLTLNDAQVSVPSGGTASVGVTVVRKGYTGPITLKLADSPAGLSFRPGTVAEGQLLGVFTVSSAAAASFSLAHLSVVGEGKGADGVVVVRPAHKVLVFAQQATLPTNTVTQTGLPAASSAALPLSVDAPSAPVEVAHGFGTPVPLKAVRGKDADGALAVNVPAPLPPGLTVTAGTIAEKAAEGTVTINTTTDLPIGLVTVAPVAKGKIAGSDRSFTVPAVTLNVVRPASVELSTASVELKPGATLEVKGKVSRKGAFKDALTVKVNGLPAGLKADPVTVAADASEFTVKIAADEKAVAATAAASVALSFQVNKKDYPKPPTAALAVKVLPAK